MLEHELAILDAFLCPQVLFWQIIVILEASGQRHNILNREPVEDLTLSNPLDQLLNIRKHEVQSPLRLWLRALHATLCRWLAVCDTHCQGSDIQCLDTADTLDAEIDMVEANSILRQTDVFVSEYA